uniref:glucuronosyltransferase n=1 Tax=Parastrongyloides trichosuri TaxID=131310 RepID=A0A0N4ZZQ4_PARTI
MFNKFFLISILFSTLSLSCSLKILGIMPQYGKSHVRFTGSTLDILAKAGHNVTFLLAKMDPLMKTTETKYVQNIVSPDNVPELEKIVNKIENKKTSFWTEEMGSVTSFFGFIEEFQKMFELHCERLVFNDTLTEEMRNEKYDLAIIEVFDYCAFGLVKAYNIPAHVSVLASALPSGLYKHFGLTFPISQTPDMFTKYSDTEFGFFTRLGNLVGYYLGSLFSDNLYERENKVFDKKFGKGFVDIAQEVRDSSFLVVNSNPFVDYAHPTLSKIIEIGGFVIPEAKKLNKEWDEILSRKKHTILISFGSVAQSSSMPIKMKKAYLEAFKRLPDIMFIWKYENMNDENVKESDNVHISKWVPQTELLNDKRLSGFLTHGGQNSLQEAAFYGVPLLCVGLFADQHRNAKVAEKIGFGKVLVKEDTYDANNLVSAFKELIDEKSEYKKNAVRVSEMIKNRPGNITKTFIEHVEFAAKFKKLPHLNMEGHKLNIFQYALVDIILFILLILFTILGIVGFLSFKIIKTIYRKIIHKEKEKDE